MDEFSGSIDGYDSHGLGLDHFNLNKFSGPDDAYYRSVRNEVVAMLRTIDTKNSLTDLKNTCEGSGQWAPVRYSETYT